jgi:hypothetical protein
MGIFLTIGCLALLAVIVHHVRRLARLRYLERAELLRIRFSALRHHLVMFAGSGQMLTDDRKAFEFLYRATTVLLRYPRFYQMFGTSTWVALRDGSYTPPHDIRKEDFSERTRPLLKEYVDASKHLANEFAHPAAMIILTASISRRRLSEWWRDVRRWLEDFKAEREEVNEWRRFSLTLL